HRRWPCGARSPRSGDGWSAKRIPQSYCHAETSSAKIAAPFAILPPPARFLREFSMQQRQLRLGDILDDYCPRERRLTNHAVVAMIGTGVHKTRCSPCDAENEYRHGKVPRQRRKSETPAAIYASARPGGPKRVVHEPAATEPLSGGGDAAEEKVTQHPQI